MDSGRRQGRRSAGSTLAATVLLVAGLSGCGDEATTGGGGADPVASPSGTAYAVGEEVPATVVGLLTQSAARGEVSPLAVVLDDRQALADFVAGFEGKQLRGDVTDAVHRADPGVDEVVVAAVVDLGCDPPTDVVVLRAEEGVRVARADKPALGLNCYVPMPPVGVLAVPATAAGPV